METTLDKLGRIVIPRRVRQSMGLEAGTVLRIEESADGIVLKQLPDGPRTRLQDGVLVVSGEVTGDSISVVARHREDRLKALASRRRRR